jgi:hypothetical protein
MTSAEALLIKRAGIKSRNKRDLIAEGACALQSDDRVLGVDSNAIRQFMLNAYKLRNGEIHGDDQNLSNLTRMDGSDTDTLGAVIDDIEQVMRRAIHLVITEEVARSQPPQTEAAPGQERQPC